MVQSLYEKAAAAMGLTKMTKLYRIVWLDTVTGNEKDMIVRAHTMQEAARKMRALEPECWENHTTLEEFADDTEPYPVLEPEPDMGPEPYTMYESFVAAIQNDDYSGMEDGEYEAAIQVCKYIGNRVIEVVSEPYFGNPEHTGAAGTVVNVFLRD